MDDPNLIQVNYTCKDANCLYTPNAMGVSISVSLSDYESGNLEIQKCPNCNGEMISDADNEIEKTLWDAGIN